LTSWFCADRFARKANLDVVPDRKVSFFLTPMEYACSDGSGVAEW
jgi:hypothetical protein